jgi:hypothetical protein
MNKHFVPEPDTEVVLASLRTVCQRLKLIEHEVVEIGIALRRGLISAAFAIEQCELVAPGCIHVIEKKP